MKRSGLLLLITVCTPALVAFVFPSLLLAVDKNSDSAAGQPSEEEPSAGPQDQSEKARFLAETLRILSQTDKLNEDNKKMTAEMQRITTENKQLTADAATLRQEQEALRQDLNTLKSSPTAGYEKGFFVQSLNKNVRLNFTGFIRPQYTLTVQRQYRTDETGDLAATADGVAELEHKIKGNDFRVENARFEAKIQLFHKAQGVVSLDFGDPVDEELTDDRPVILVDAFAEYSFFKELSLRAGQFKVPFDLETSFNDRDLIFDSRSLMTGRYALYVDDSSIDETDPLYRSAYDTARGSSFGRDVGAMAFGSAFGGRFSYSAGVFNGAGFNRENDNRDVLVSGRLAYLPFGEMSDTMSDSALTESLRLSIGAGVAYDLVSHTYPLFPEDEYNSSDISGTLDVLAKWRGLSGFASVFYRRSDHGRALYDSNEVLSSIGAQAQVSYYIAPVRLEPAVRYSFYKARFDREGDQVHEASCALLYHVLPEHLQVGIEYRGLFPNDKEASYLVPLGVRYDYQHEMIISAEVGF
jgi:hypothetical protein